MLQTGRDGEGRLDLEPYEALVAARKGCRYCVELSPGRLRSCGEFPFDPAVVSHWEQWLGHRRPQLVVVGQDFGNVDYYLRNRGRDDPQNKTNENLWKLLLEAGFTVGYPSRLDPHAPIFLTNSILCVKEGAMNAAIRASWVTACAQRHLLPLIGYLRPAAIVGMGSHGWRAVRQVFRLVEAPGRISLAAGSSWTAADGTRVFAVGHCSPLGIINRPWVEQTADWRRIGEVIWEKRPGMNANYS